MSKINGVDHDEEEEEEEEDCDDEEEEEFKTELTEKFTKLLDELEDCDGNEQRKKIEEMNGLIDEMDKEELRSVFTIENFDKIEIMIEKKKIPIENAILLMKRIGCWIAMNHIWIRGIEKSSLHKELEKMIVDTEKKKEEKNEKLLVDLLECYTMILDNTLPGNMPVICLRCLLKAASNKGGNEETQKEVEMALLALANISCLEKIKKEYFYEEIKEIILFHQESRNLTRLAYQSAWFFLIKRYNSDKSLEHGMVNELHFIREAARELEEFSKCVDWKREKEEEEDEEEEEEEDEKIAKDLFVLREWFHPLSLFFDSFKMRNEEIVGLIGSIARVLRAVRENYDGVSHACIYSLRKFGFRRNVEVDDFLKGSAVDIILKEILRPTLDDEKACNCLVLFVTLSSRLKEEKDDEKEEEERKATKMEMLEKMEEGGYEDAIVSFHKKLSSLCQNYCDDLPLNISDYFVDA
ncbi:uncharacterized protein MONOS_8850 [Monocercomonoides exilis]|uniref:uncharacterized protein n=1 Tax=Monocercomonoides exilis TaxID=2049356 RepID=UPI0035595756|nr:hypothetical protein MONOS_8850 [Monocercomonoides exilis]|eukprot:MONOS_8850.1-p1 / transcript=MONOS_8850.1 / gene=MONOS_8850 / organism=Monocercomonoides_exilis_PA203 / gene_product=unspecified product / transcript_product=unspecified product / location=Mono_scaffold00345:57269-58795(-) / protein_length=467 / sequence_SO=supercontig / SO=protein_coding / is_pseudo=false